MNLTILVGSSRGLGKELAKQLQKMETSLVCLSTQNPGKQSQYGLWLKTDLMDIESLQSSTENIKQNYPDCSELTLILNAGVGQYGGVTQITPELMSRQFNINVLGNHALLHYLCELYSTPVNIVAISSIYGIQTQCYKGAYAASKMALEALIESYSMEHPKSRVMIVRPAGIKTQYLSSCREASSQFVPKEMADYMSSPAYRGFSSPEKVASRIIKQMKRKRWPKYYHVDIAAKGYSWLMKLIPSVAIPFVLNKLYRSEIRNKKPI